MISIASDLAGIIRPGVVAFDGLRATEKDVRLDGLLREAEAAVRARPPAGTDAVRSMYRKVGLDPTRRRPSSEALLRRVLRGEPLPRINTLVDVCNWCSVECQLPYGLYDLEAIRPPIVLRLGAPGESYAGIGKDEVHVGGRLTLADALGPFGNPSSDSSRTMVTAATTRALAVIYAPAGLEPLRLEQALQVTSQRILAAAGGRETARLIV